MYSFHVGIKMRGYFLTLKTGPALTKIQLDIYAPSKPSEQALMLVSSPVIPCLQEQLHHGCSLRL